MAVFQLGALVTEIVGSIGGTTFKRQGSSRVMMRKSNGASRAQVLQNPRLGLNASIFRSWSTLPNAEKVAWNSIAAANKVDDKFGNPVNISGVAFQRKMLLQVQYLGFTPDVYNWDNKVNTISFFNVPAINWTNSTFEIIFDCLNGPTLIALAVVYSLQPLQEPNFILRGVFFSSEFENQQSYDLFDEMTSFYGINDSAYVLGLYAYVFTPSGMVGTPIFAKVFSED